MSDITNWLSGLTVGNYGAFFERVDEVILEDHNIMYTSTTGTNLDKYGHIDRQFQYSKNDKVYTSDAKGPRKTIDKERYCDDIPLEFKNRSGDRGSLFGDEDYINQYVVDDDGNFWLYKFDRKQLANWAMQHTATTKGHYYVLWNVGKGQLMFAPLADITDPRTPVNYSKYDVNVYVRQVYQEVLENGLKCLKRLNPKGN